MQFTTLACLAALSAVILKLLYDALRSPLRDIPGPFLAKFTNLWRLYTVWTGQAEVVQRQLHEKYGPVVRLGPDCVTLADPALIKTVYGVKEKWIKSDFYAVNDFRLGKKVFPTGFSTRSEEQHTQITKPINKFYTPTAVLRYEERMNEIIKLLLDRLDSDFASTTTAKTCPIDKWMHYCAWDIIASITFGSAFGFLASGTDVQGLILSSQKSTDYFALVGQIPRLDFLLDKNPVLRLGPPSSSAAAGFAAKQLAARLSGKDGHDAYSAPDFLDDFLALKDSDPASQVTDQRIVQWLMRNVGAGSDSTAISLRSVLYFLCRRPAAMAALQAELDGAGISETVRRGGAVGYAALQKLPYLAAVVTESFRLHPAVALALERRVPEQGFTLPDGRTLPPGTVVGINPAVLQRQRGIFGEDADEFRPERWMRLRADGGGEGEGWAESEAEFEARTARMKEADLTFGFGKRVCAGRHVAVIEVFKITACLVAKFNIELARGTGPEGEWKVRNSWFHRQWGIDVVIKRRGVKGE